MTPAPDTPEARAQLKKILESSIFLRAPRQALMLRHAAVQTMEGKWNRLSQKEIAHDLFGPAGQLALVGLTANRIRASLVAYYREEGRADPLLFLMPQGGYSIHVSRRTVTTALRYEVAVEPTISMRDFRTFLESRCGLGDDFRRDRDQRVRYWMSSLARFKATTLRAGAEFDQLFQHLEGAPLSFEQMKSLTRSLGIHPLMLDHLRSKRVATNCLVVDTPGFESQTGATEVVAGEPTIMRTIFLEVPSPGEGYGTNAQYSFPALRIAGSDISLVFLELSPAGYSDTHDHPGDELMFVISGSITVTFPNSGVRLLLNEGDYAHFFAEQPHSAVNESEERARLLIVRFNHLTSPDARHQLGREIWGIISAAGSGTPTPFREPALSWVAEAAVQPLGSGAGRFSQQATDSLQNHLGFCRLLRRLPGPSPRAAESFVKSIAEGHGLHLESFDHWLWCVETGRIAVERDLVPAIAKLYGVYPTLILDFFQPSSLCQVVVRGGPTNNHKTGGNRNGDWLPLTDVARGLDLVSVADGVTYSLPQHTLSCSDTSITLVSLVPGTLTPINDHPGTELLVPLDGEIAVEFVKTGADSHRASSGEVLHFTSSEPHRLANYGPIPARVLVLRIYSDCVGGKDDSGP